MSDFMPTPSNQVAVAEARQQRFSEDVIDSLDASNMRPWCRACRRRVDRYLYDRYADGFIGFTVWCHGETMGGLIPYMAPHYGCVLEVFCDDDPQAREGRWFWIGSDGIPLQPPREYIRTTAIPGAFTSGFGRFARDNGTWIGLMPMIILMAVQILWRLR